MSSRGGRDQSGGAGALKLLPWYGSFLPTFKQYVYVAIGGHYYSVVASAS